MLLTTISLKAVLPLAIFTSKSPNFQMRSVFPMAKPCNRFLLKRRWRKWHKRNSIVA